MNIFDCATGKDLYTYLTESYGLPIWLALAIFVVVTIMLGLMLGIGLILCIDLVFPPKKYPTEAFLDNQVHTFRNLLIVNRKY